MKTGLMKIKINALYKSLKLKKILNIKGFGILQTLAVSAVLLTSTGVLMQSLLNAKKEAKAYTSIADFTAFTSQLGGLFLNKSSCTNTFNGKKDTQGKPIAVLLEKGKANEVILYGAEGTPITGQGQDFPGFRIMNVLLNLESNPIATLPDSDPAKPPLASIYKASLSVSGSTVGLDGKYTPIAMKPTIQMSVKLSANKELLSCAQVLLSNGETTSIPYCRLDETLIANAAGNLVCKKTLCDLGWYSTGVATNGTVSCDSIPRCAGGFALSFQNSKFLCGKLACEAGTDTTGRTEDGFLKCGKTIRSCIPDPNQPDTFNDNGDRIKYSKCPAPCTANFTVTPTTYTCPVGYSKDSRGVPAEICQEDCANKVEIIASDALLHGTGPRTVKDCTTIKGVGPGRDEIAKVARDVAVGSNPGLFYCKVKGSQNACPAGWTRQYAELDNNHCNGTSPTITLGANGGIIRNVGDGLIGIGYVIKIAAVLSYGVLAAAVTYGAAINDGYMQTVTEVFAMNSSYTSDRSSADYLEASNAVGAWTDPFDSLPSSLFKADYSTPKGCAFPTTASNKCTVPRYVGNSPQDRPLKNCITSVTVNRHQECTTCLAIGVCQCFWEKTAGPIHNPNGVENGLGSDEYTWCY